MSLPIVVLERALAPTRDLDDALPVMDEEEFRSFYERTARPLWAYLSRLTGRPQQADDLLQEAYYRFLRAAARHDSEAHRRNSLFQIATNLVRDGARRSLRRPEVASDGADSPRHPVDGAPLPEHRATLRADLGRALQRLEPVQREMLWLAYAQGASHREIAAILGLRAVSVRTMLLRARRKLAAILDGGPPSAETGR